MESDETRSQIQSKRIIRAKLIRVLADNTTKYSMTTDIWS